MCLGLQAPYLALIGSSLALFHFVPPFFWGGRGEGGRLRYPWYPSSLKEVFRLWIIQQYQAHNHEIRDLHLLNCDARNAAKEACVSSWGWRFECARSAVGGIA